MLAPDLWAQNKGRPARLESLFPFSSGKTMTLFKKPKRTNILKAEVISRDATGPDGDPYTCWARRTMQRSSVRRGGVHHAAGTWAGSWDPCLGHSAGLWRAHLKPLKIIQRCWEVSIQARIAALLGRSSLSGADQRAAISAPLRPSRLLLHPSSRHQARAEAGSEENRRGKASTPF